MQHITYSVILVFCVWKLECSAFPGRAETFFGNWYGFILLALVRWVILSSKFTRIRLQETSWKRNDRFLYRLMQTKFVCDPFSLLRMLLEYY